MKRKNHRGVLWIWLLIAGILPAAAQTNAGEKALAGDTFRIGVHAYYRGAFNDAVDLFEKSLSGLPTENLIIDWLGKAYYKSGLEGTALQQWEAASAAGYGGLVLKNKIDIVRSRRNAVSGSSARFVESGSFPSRSESTIFYSQPTSVVPMADGSCWVAAYGSNEIVHFDINGVILNTVRGPATGFRRPMDIAVLDDGRMLVTEYAAHRVSVLSEHGIYITAFGEKGRGNGQFSGPQYITFDSSAIYVTDFGNARVAVFSHDFVPLFTFGTPRGNFKGLKAPGGIAALNGTIYVADQMSGNFHMFDKGGNYIGELLEPGTLGKPEAVTVADDMLIVADGSRILTVDPRTAYVRMTADIGNGGSALMCAARDCNGNIIAADFAENRILILSDMTDLVGGMFVQIEKVIAEDFPRVSLEISVEDRRRNPVSGLNERNFYISEEQRPAALVALDGAAYASSTADITVLVERSAESLPYENAQKMAIAEIAAAMNGAGVLRVISAGEIPAIEYEGPPSGAVSFTGKKFRVNASPSWNFDLGLRLAANKCITGEKKRGILFLTTGTFSDVSFKRYGLTDLSAYLNNNSIIFSTVNLQQQRTAPENAYITEQTGGKSYYVFRPEGLGGVVGDIVNAPNGHYIVSYTSALPTDFGRKYLPVEVEVYLMNRSGRDNAGYFAPLE